MQQKMPDAPEIKLADEIRSEFPKKLLEEDFALVINFKNGPIAHFSTSCIKRGTLKITNADELFQRDVNGEDDAGDSCTNTLTVKSTDVPWKAMIIGAEKYEETEGETLREYQAK